jgi:hypothetical protein
MAEKITMIKQLKAYVEMYKKEKKFRYGEIRFCGMFNTGVLISGVDDIFKIAKHLGINVKINDFNSEIYGKKVSVMYEGVEFFALGTNEEVAEVNV